MTILLHSTVSYFSENRPLPGSESHPLFKYTSTRSVFELFLPIHMKTVKRWKYDSIPCRVWVMQQSMTKKNRTANHHPPPPPEIKNEAAQKPKRAILSSLIREEMESLNSPSILSKIVVVLMIYDIIVFENLRFRPSTRKQKAGDFKNHQLLPENTVDGG